MLYHFFLALAYIYGGLSLFGIIMMNKSELKDVPPIAWWTIMCSWAFIIASWLR